MKKWPTPTRMCRSHAAKEGSDVVQDFKGKTAVITGGASGIGWALARQAAREGMKIVLSDIESDALQRATAVLAEEGADVIGIEADVASASDIQRLANRTMVKYGSVHMLFNNAGVVLADRIWETSAADWDWIIDVNLRGVINGIRVFVLIMLDQGDPCHVVNTGSMAGLVSGPRLGAYKVTKFGVVSLSETLHFELAEIEADVGVSVLSFERVWPRPIAIDPALQAITWMTLRNSERPGKLRSPSPSTREAALIASRSTHSKAFARESCTCCLTPSTALGCWSAPKKSSTKPFRNVKNKEFRRQALGPLKVICDNEHCAW